MIHAAVLRTALAALAGTPLIAAWPWLPTDPGAAASSAPAPAAAPPVKEPRADAAPSTSSPSVESRAACSGEQVSAVGQAVADWLRRYQAAEQSAYEAHHCASPDILCLDRFGEATHDQPPAGVRAGKSFTVDLIVPTVDRGRLAVSMSVGAKAAAAAGPFVEAPPPLDGAPKSGASCDLSAAELASLKAAALPAAQLSARPGLGLGLPPGSGEDAYWANAGSSSILSEWAAWVAAYAGRAPIFTVVEATVEVPSSSLSLDVDVARSESGSASGSAGTHYSIWIDPGRYYLEASVLVPFVFRGHRTTTLTPTADGGALRVGIDQDWHTTAALMIDFFPVGRQKGQVSSFEHCAAGSCVDDWLALQAGLGLGDLFQEWYLGLMFEPVSGFAIAAGASFLKGDFLGPGLAEGMLLPSTADFSSHSAYMVRPYFGVALTTDIVQTIDRAATRIR